MKSRTYDTLIGGFQTTRWELITKATEPQGRDREEALGELCRIYWPAVYAYIRRKGFSPFDAQDLTQEFLFQLVKGAMLKEVHQDKGRFRSYLAACCNHHLSNFRDAAQTLKRGGDITITGTVVGTPQYIAPEVLTGSGRDFSPASELYAIGAILYEMLTGGPPFVGNSLGEIAENIRRRDPVPPSRIRTSIPKSLDAICLKALRKKPQQRYASAQELADALQDLLKESVIQPDTAQSNRRLSILKSSAMWLIPITLVMIGGAFIWTHFNHLNEAPAPSVPATQNVTPFVTAIDSTTPGIIHVLPGDSHILPDQSFLTVGNFWVTTEDHWLCPPLNLRQWCDPIWVTLRSPCIDFDFAMTFTAANDVDMAAYSEAVPETSLNQDYVALLGKGDDGLSQLRLFGLNKETLRQHLSFSGRHTMQLSRHKGWVVVLLDSKPILAHPDPNPALRINRLFVWGGFNGSQQVYDLFYRTDAMTR